MSIRQIPPTKVSQEKLILKLRSESPSFPTQLYFHTNQFLPFKVIHQFFEIRVIDEFVLLKNAAIIKCLVPSFLSDFVQVISWLIIDDETVEIDLASSEQKTGKITGSARNPQSSESKSIFCSI
jgi:hypothetical protein